MTHCRRYQHSSLIAESTSVYITIPKEEAFSFGLGCKSSIAHRTKTNKGYFYLKLLAICDLLTIVWTVPQELIIKVAFVGIQALCCTICATLDCSRARDPSCLQSELLQIQMHNLGKTSERCQLGRDSECHVQIGWIVDDEALFQIDML